MIIHLPKNITRASAHAYAESAGALCLEQPEHYVLITNHTVKQLPTQFADIALNHWVFQTDMQLSSRQYMPETHRIAIGDTYIGGDGKNQLMIAGPCAVESREQIEQSCQMLKQQGIRVLRAGSYKPRTSPYTFRGLGEDGLKLLAEMREKYGLLIATEMRDATHADKVVEYADIVQVGAKAMYDHGLLTAAGQSGKPVILKRGFGSTLQELVNCADFIMSCGNDQVILCERGIRSFETNTRFTLDLCGVAWLKEHCNLPIILDPSHAMGYVYGIGDLARACTAMGVDGLLIETHPCPSCAQSDAAQQLDHQQFADMYASLQPIAKAVGKTLV
ncbi:MAG: bifunctional 3-deoxy-7-phosphoheptulonate synthase/chorismate mutase [Paludibacteraceae bacterium]|nr:bifunctional 3-deoxy-7-phosphoheptulonate synthase/chorismate mutase [Paludibacteraceae bacterium]